jgi:hypothetical protein
VISVGSELEVGAEDDAVELPDLSTLLGLGAPTKPRRTRLFRLGWLWLLVQGLRGRALPLPTRLVPEPWPDIPQPLMVSLSLHKRLSFAYM